MYDHIVHECGVEQAVCYAIPKRQAKTAYEHWREMIVEDERNLGYRPPRDAIPNRVPCGGSSSCWGNDNCTCEGLPPRDAIPNVVACDCAECQAAQYETHEVRGAAGTGEREADSDVSPRANPGHATRNSGAKPILPPNDVLKAMAAQVRAEFGPDVCGADIVSALTARECQDWLAGRTIPNSVASHPCNPEDRCPICEGRECERCGGTITGPEHECPMDATRNRMEDEQT